MSCRSGNSNNKDEKENAYKLSSSPLTIDTFSETPAEISGCSCFYSTDSVEFKQLKYIYVSDFNELSFMKINGKLIQFKQTNINRKQNGSLEITATCKPYELFITVKSISGENKQEEEYSLEAGVIIVRDDKGNSITKPLYGSCGC
jgi:hypothetical protein